MSKATCHTKCLLDGRVWTPGEIRESLGGPMEEAYFNINDGQTNIDDDIDNAGGDPSGADLVDEGPTSFKAMQDLDAKQKSLSTGMLAPHANDVLS